MSFDLGIMLAICDGLVLVVVGLPMYLRWVPPNRFWGFRVAATLGDRRRWYWANRRAGRRLIVVGIASPLAAVIAGVLAIDTLLAGTTVMVVGCLWMVIRGWREIARDVAEHTSR